ncbi:MAG TPA: membrane dipeptidase [Solirubrobacterales bacterium]|nr:membrane dipeptidase [Solirubrobacterales bacterium]
MIADMHCHYPTHLLAEDPGLDLAAADPATQAITKVSGRPGWVNKLRALALKIAANVINYEDDRWRVSLDELERGNVRAVFSVLMEPGAEYDFDEPYGAAPEDTYFGDILHRLHGVEDDLKRIDPGNARQKVVISATDLEATLAAGKVAFMHCVEGGLHLGKDPEEIKANVATLKAKHVVYVTLAHLFWRQVATNAPAIPFLSDRVYKLVFCQPKMGLTELGRAAVEAMYEQRMLIDLTHMSGRAIDDTLDLLDELDRRTGAPPDEHPVVATHAGYRFGKQEYMLTPERIERIARRDGVIGLILARHQINDGLDLKDPDDPAETVAVLRRHIDEIRAIVPSHTNAHVGIGSDLDGFIKPTVAGIETAADLASLEMPLREAYGADADEILCGNALRMARKALGGP